MSSLRRRQYHPLLGLAILMFTLLFTQFATAQTSTGTISGTVVDPAGRVIPGASLTLMNEKTGESRKISSNASGEFSFLTLQPGTYTVKAEQQGFSTFER